MELDLELASVAVSATSLVPQRYQVEFVAEASTPRIAADGNIVRRGRSGNPGYLPGLPLLNAQLVNLGGARAMLARVPGLAVYGASGPHCIDADPSDFINFGEDTITGCSLQLDFQQFSQLCSLQGQMHAARS